MAARRTSKKTASATSSIRRVKPGVRFSGAVVHGNTVYLGGKVAANTKGGITAQTKSVLKEVEAALKAAGSSKSKLLDCMVYLSDMRYFAEYNKVWDAWVDRANMPTRATVEARLATPDYLIEIVAVAAL